MQRRTDLAIVNRSFWPQSQVIGEGLLQLAESVASEHSVCVITQTTGDLRGQLAAAGRGQGVKVLACKAMTTSASGVLMRAAEAIAFMGWTLLSLLRSRPAKVYVSTDPPVVVPFVVAVYCRLFGAEYTYHLQDIHPEAAQIVVPLNRWVLRLLRALDNFTLRHARQVITLAATMRDYLKQRSGTHAPIALLDNPAVDVEPSGTRDMDVVFCGNAGRLQRIPLVIAAIKEYLSRGGKLKFTFAGGGVHAPDLQKLAGEFNQVTYLGVIPAVDAAALVGRHRWALMPIEDEVTRYAFPSKSSSYALAGARILAICGADTSVARWVQDYEVGMVCQPVMESVVDAFFHIENQDAQTHAVPEKLSQKLQIRYFVQQLRDQLWEPAT